MKERLIAVQERMAAAMKRAGRSDSVTLIAVTKNHPLEAMEEVAQLGVTNVGENRVQEAKEKKASYEGPELRWHMIGHLQTNKVRQAVPMFDLIHSVDSIRLLDEINRVADKCDKVQDILLQINLAKEESKDGMMLEEYLDVRAHADSLPNVRLRGLMVIAPAVDDPEEVRPIFRIAAALFADMQGHYPQGQIDTLSMGMTHDFEIAIEEGATAVRIGSAIFGERVYK